MSPQARPHGLGLGPGLAALGLVVGLAAGIGCGRRAASARLAGEPGPGFGEDAGRSAEAAYQRIQLGEALRYFQQDLGRSPTNIAEIVRLGYLPELPVPPQGGHYVLHVGIRGTLPADIVHVPPPPPAAPAEPVPSG